MIDVTPNHTRTSAARRSTDARSARRALHFRVTDGPAAGATGEIASGKAIVGRAASADILVPDATVSQFHLELEATDAGIEVSDLGSHNGTHAGTVEIRAARVATGTELRFGQSAVVKGDAVRSAVGPPATEPGCAILVTAPTTAALPVAVAVAIAALLLVSSVFAGSVGVASMRAAPFTSGTGTGPRSARKTMTPADGSVLLPSMVTPFSASATGVRIFATAFHAAARRALMLMRRVSVCARSAGSAAYSCAGPTIFRSTLRSGASSAAAPSERSAQAPASAPSARSATGRRAFTAFPGSPAARRPWRRWSPSSCWRRGRGSRSSRPSGSAGRARTGRAPCA